MPRVHAGVGAGRGSGRVRPRPGGEGGSHHPRRARGADGDRARGRSPAGDPLQPPLRIHGAVAVHRRQRRGDPLQAGRLPRLRRVVGVPLQRRRQRAPLAATLRDQRARARRDRRRSDGDRARPHRVRRGCERGSGTVRGDSGAAVPARSGTYHTARGRSATTGAPRSRAPARRRRARRRRTAARIAPGAAPGRPRTGRTAGAGATLDRRGNRRCGTSAGAGSPSIPPAERTPQGAACQV